MNYAGKQKYTRNPGNILHGVFRNLNYIVNEYKIPVVLANFISKPAFEDVPKGDSAFRLKREQKKYLTYPWHYHPEYELTYIIKGTGNRFAGNHVEPFYSNDFVLMGGNLPHVWKNGPEYQENNELTTDCIVLQFQHDCLGKDFFEIPEMKGVKEILNQSKYGISFSRKTGKKALPLLHEMLESDKVGRLTRFLEVLDICARDEKMLLLTATPVIADKNEMDIKRINKIYEYVINNLDKELKMEEISGKLGLTVSSFCRYFKSRTGQTFTEFANRVKIEYACSLLLSGKYSLTAICFESGYNNLSYFNRNFKSIKKMTPTQYREKFAKNLWLNE